MPALRAFVVLSFGRRCPPRQSCTWSRLAPAKRSKLATATGHSPWSRIPRRRRVHNLRRNCSRARSVRPALAFA